MQQEQSGPTYRLRRALVVANKRLFATMRSEKTSTVLDMRVRPTGFAELSRYTHCLVVTYRKDGTPMPQPVWPGYDGDRVYLWTEVEAYKAKRLRRNPEVLIAPCSFRGKPLGQPIAARGRILETDTERAHAESVIRSQWGWKRAAFAAASRPLTAVHYIELTPINPAGNPTAGERT